MCLFLAKNRGHYVTYKKTSKLWQKLQKNGKITFWKIYREKGRHLVSAVKKIDVTGPGNVNSDRSDKKLLDKERYAGNVDKGIHVFTYKPKLHKYYDVGFVVPVICRKEDFVAFNEANYYGREYGTAVFMKVEIAQKTWNKVLPKNQRKEK